MANRIVLKILLISTIICVACSASQYSEYKIKSDYQITQDTKSAAPIISGAIEWHQWREQSLWNFKAMDSKSVDLLLARSICNIINNGDYFLIIFAGSWCEDSESQLPIIFKLFEKGGLKSSKYQLIGVDRNKEAYNISNLKYSPDKVPSLIILHNNAEIGRVEELPEKSWEQDIISILYRN